jgi:hypothetical protein
LHQTLLLRFKREEFFCLSIEVLSPSLRAFQTSRHSGKGSELTAELKLVSYSLKLDYLVDVVEPLDKLILSSD